MQLMQVICFSNSLATFEDSLDKLYLAIAYANCRMVHKVSSQQDWVKGLNFHVEEQAEPHVKDAGFLHQNSLKAK